MIKVYITKYALTKGIIEMEGKIEPPYFKTRQRGIIDLFRVNEFHLTMEEAVKDAEKRRLKKIRSLEKQIEKLKNLKF